MHGDYLFLNEICTTAGLVDASLLPLVTPLTPPVLSTLRLTLEPIRDIDLDAIYQIYSDEAVVRYFGQDRMENLEQARFWLDVQLRMQAIGLGLAWTLRLKPGGQVVGTVCFDGINRQWHCTGISYGLHPDYWNQGLMSEALAAVLALAFEGGLACPIHRIQALVFSDNRASIRVLEKLGFIFEGQRLGQLFWQERYWDLDSYCRLNPN